MALPRRPLAPCWCTSVSSSRKPEKETATALAESCSSETSVSFRSIVLGLKATSSTRHRKAGLLARAAECLPYQSDAAKILVGPPPLDPEPDFSNRPLDGERPIANNLTKLVAQQGSISDATIHPDLSPSGISLPSPSWGSDHALVTAVFSTSL